MLSRSILDSYIPLLHYFSLDHNTNTEQITVPRLKKTDLIDLLRKCKEIFRIEPTLLRLEGDFNIIGDIHGNLKDLLRIISFTGLQMSIGFVFLGDYVDKGDLSIESIVLILAMKLAYPTKVFMIRGNHEFDNMNNEYGFKKQVFEVYDDDVYEAFHDCFSCIPLAALVNQEHLCMHGGLGPGFVSLNQIEQIERPIFSVDTETKFSQILDSILWSDPSEMIQQYTNNNRGKGFVYGGSAVNKFLQNNNLKTIIRSHQCVDGYKELFDGGLITVFSSSCYSKNPVNRCGLLQIIRNEQITKKHFPASEPISKMNIDYKIVEVSQTIPLCQRRLSLPFTKTTTNMKRMSFSVKSDRMKKSFVRN
ncbi:Ser/Thr protein phosphatase, putative [Trichomonas vaginalis G3]|uniref:Serine/threonine-protein phosphatase n=1 Tax=Trichomonas vaginalis (strain ATCC PRA-98 / G3) TaxID=412133 RepID=A2GC28_TRIV3|nr:phosphoprotein phosphatase protein [Trichomonas vaginalis G3]EAX85289.1 Ser/Thr protein phosphatase, putative [Trichomonas vaginalis G3]KAI5492437.1 phosphoprotein phosphatase protein [Trichomonas vaginalis G3]|eukprot:XP_001298219.1 Ser/Thr protein phosphatase [Trichomonas vaginalis G3]